MRTAFLCRRLHNALTALALFLAMGVLSVPSHAQEQNRNADNARDMAAQALFNQALLTEQQEAPEKAIAKYEEIMQRHGRAPTPSTRQFAARALLKKGKLLGEQNNAKDAFITFDRIERNFGNEKSPAMREILALALVSKAEAFYKQGDTEKALNAYAELDQQFRDDDNDSIRRLVEITKWRATEIRISNNIALSSRQ